MVNRMCSICCKEYNRDMLERVQKGNRVKFLCPLCLKEMEGKDV